MGGGCPSDRQPTRGGGGRAAVAEGDRGAIRAGRKRTTKGLVRACRTKEDDGGARSCMQDERGRRRGWSAAGERDRKNRHPASAEGEHMRLPGGRRIRPCPTSVASRPASTESLPAADAPTRLQRPRPRRHRCVGREVCQRVDAPAKDAIVARRKRWQKSALLEGSAGKGLHASSLGPEQEGGDGHERRRGACWAHATARHKGIRAHLQRVEHALEGIRRRVELGDVARSHGL